jgi:hypothetical protein
MQLLIIAKRTASKNPMGLFVATKLLKLVRSAIVGLMMLNVKKHVVIQDKVLQHCHQKNKLPGPRKNAVNENLLPNAHLVRDHAVKVTVNLLTDQKRPSANIWTIVRKMRFAMEEMPHVQTQIQNQTMSQNVTKEPKSANKENVKIPFVSNLDLSLVF